MTGYPQNTECRPVDLTRSCFRAYRFVHGVPTPGRYYFLDGKTEFANRSKLGIHIWEDHPFQPGELGTADIPAPTWVNGALPAGLEHCAPQPPITGTACQRLAAYPVVRAVQWLRRDYDQADDFYPIPPADFSVDELGLVHAADNRNSDQANVYRGNTRDCTARFSVPFIGTNHDIPFAVLEVPEPGPGYLGTWTWVDQAICWPDDFIYSGIASLRCYAF